MHNFTARCILQCNCEWSFLLVNLDVWPAAESHIKHAKRIYSKYQSDSICFPLTCLRRLASPATMRTSHNWIWFFQLYLCSVPNTTSSSKSKSQQCFSLIATFCATWKYRRSYVAFTCISASKHKHLKALWFLLCAFVISGYQQPISLTSL